MKRLLLIILAMLLLNVGVTGATPFDDALAAYNRGDYTTALKIFRPLAAQGIAEAQFNLGYMYYFGRGVPQDYAEAVKWHRLAAAQVIADAQFNLGMTYSSGRGVPQDYVEAVKWYRLAAAQGHADAQFNLGMNYSSGRGVPQDYVRAHMWSNLAAISGDADAVKNRENTAKKMTPAQIAEAQKLARDCQARQFKNCG